jgi:hypothetical protein
MKLPDEEKAVSDIAKEFALQLSAAKRLFEYIYSVVNGATAKNKESVNSCLLAVLVRMLRMHYAAVKLASLGIASEAKLQIRAMLEMCINIYALQQSPDPEEYARNWVAWDLHNYMKQVETELKLHPEKKPLFDEHFKLANPVKVKLDANARKEGSKRWPANPERIEKYIKCRWKDFLAHGPSMLDLRSLATRVDVGSAGEAKMVGIYDYIYPNSSGVIHGSELATMVSGLNATEIVLKLAPSRDFINTIVVTSTCLLQTGASLICGLLKIGPANMAAEIYTIAKSGIVPDMKP